MKTFNPISADLFVSDSDDGPILGLRLNGAQSGDAALMVPLSPEFAERIGRDLMVYGAALGEVNS